MADQSHTLLIVDDEGAVADTYATILTDSYGCRVAYSGREALQKYDAEVDVVLLDRRMPDLSGDEVLEKIRDRPGESRVAMVTAVDPDFDVIEMGFDEYLVKPVAEAELRETVESLLRRTNYGMEMQRYFSLVTKRAALEAEKHTADLADSDDYQSLLAEIDELEAELDDLVDDLTLEDYAMAFREVTRDGPAGLRTGPAA